MVKSSKRWLKQIIKETASASTPRRKPFGELSYGVGTGAHIEDEEGNIYLVIDVRQKMGSYRPVRVIKNVATGKVRNLPVEEYYRSFYPVADSLKEGTHEKLNADVTGDSSNLDQEIYFGLKYAIIDVVQKFVKNPRYAKYGVTFTDVLEELKIVLEDFEHDLE